MIARSERGTRLYFYERDVCTISVRRAWSPPSSLHWTLFGSAEVAPTLSSPLYPPSSKYALPASELEAGLQPSSNADHWSGQSPRSSAKIFLKLVVQSYSPLYSRGSKATVRVGITRNRADKRQSPGLRPAFGGDMATFNNYVQPVF